MVAAVHSRRCALRSRLLTAQPTTRLFRLTSFRSIAGVVPSNVNHFSYACLVPIRRSLGNTSLLSSFGPRVQWVKSMTRLELPPAAHSPIFSSLELHAASRTLHACADTLAVKRKGAATVPVVVRDLAGLLVLDEVLRVLRVRNAVSTPSESEQQTVEAVACSWWRSEPHCWRG